ncbi:MAG: hypothetical protein AB1390_01705 [Nitrospirota bacterium]
MSDSGSGTWEYKIIVGGNTLIQSTGQRYYVIETLGYDNPQDASVLMLRSNSSAVYFYNGFGNEHLVFQNAPIGTKWTYESGHCEVQEREIEAVETVTVPAGTFEGCLKFVQRCLSDDPIAIYTREWIKPGFGMVQEIDYYGGVNPPRVKKLKSWTLF